MGFRLIAFFKLGSPLKRSVQEARPDEYRNNASAPKSTTGTN